MTSSPPKLPAQSFVPASRSLGPGVGILGSDLPIAVDVGLEVRVFSSEQLVAVVVVCFVEMWVLSTPPLCCFSPMLHLKEGRIALASAGLHSLMGRICARQTFLDGWSVAVFDRTYLVLRRVEGTEAISLIGEWLWTGMDTATRVSNSDPINNDARELVYDS